MTGSNLRVLALIVIFFGIAIAALWKDDRVSMPAPMEQTLNKDTSVQVEMPVSSDVKRVQVIVGAGEVTAEVAETAEERAQGLSGRDPLQEGEGMLFVFPAKGAYSFWNHEMRFALDLIWIDGDTVVDVSENLPRFTGSAVTVMPSAPADKVLEVNAGFVKAHAISKGDAVRIISLDTL